MTTVYLLDHLRPEGDRYEEDLKRIGIYLSRESAEQVAERLRLQPGFRDYPDGFQVVEYELDRDAATR